MMHYTTAQALGRARIADLHHQARRNVLARAARAALCLPKMSSVQVRRHAGIRGGEVEVVA
jgi:hypothetical protein